MTLLIFLKFDHENTVVANSAKITETPRSQSVSGYGSKLPTRYMLTYKNRWHRVYAICFSNCATFYVLIKGKRVLVDIERE